MPVQRVQAFGLPGGSGCAALKGIINGL